MTTKTQSQPVMFKNNFGFKANIRSQAYSAVHSIQCNSTEHYSLPCHINENKTSANTFDSLKYEGESRTRGINNNI